MADARTYPDCGGTHEGFDFPAEDGERLGLPGVSVDTATIAALVGAAFDGCQPCQGRWLDVIQSDPLAVTRLVEVAAMFVQGAFGGIPSAMTRGGPSVMSEEYRQLIGAGVDTDNHQPMLAAAQAMTDAQRRIVVGDALDTIIGHMSMGGAGDG